MQGYDLLRDGAGIVELDFLSLVSFTGEDRKGWLQGQATNNLRSIDLGASISFCICAPSGQMQAACDLWGLHGRFVSTCHRSTLPALMERVRQMVIMEDVQAQDLTGSYTLVSIQGPAASRELSDLVTLPTLDAAESRIGEVPVLCLRANHSGMGGWDIWVPSEERKTLAKLAKHFPRVSREAYEVARLEAGIPLFGQDMDGRTLPPEMGPAFEAKTVSYNKGCYTGQEVLMRIHSRGHTNRTWMGLLADAPLEAGAPITHPSRPDAGIVTSAVFSPIYGEIAGAMMRNEVAAPMEAVTVQTSRGPVEAELRQMPILRFE